MDDLLETFERLFGNGTVGHIRSPLRICPLGAHVDHQQGLVTGMALDISVDLVYMPDDDGYIRVQSLDFPDEDYFQIDNVPDMLPGFWGNYIRGAVLSLSRDYKLHRGVRGVVKGRLPSAGLSTSASVTTAYLLALCDVNEIECDGIDLIKYSHWVETTYIGLKNGILDQAANVLSRKGMLLSVDCRTNDWQLIHAGASMPEYQVVIVNSGFSKALISTDYNNRVDECRIAASVLSEYAGKRPQNLNAVCLRDVEPEEWAQFQDRLPGRFANRARHFFQEYDRVIKGVEAWRAGDLVAFGSLMSQSGESSIHNYQCGCKELITIYETLKACRGVYGARFSGAGYRGCCVGIVDPARKQDIIKAISSAYPIAHPEYATKYSITFCDTADGASVVRPYSA